MAKTREFPDDGELVVGTVREVKGFGAFATLDEYPGKEGFIHIAEVATGWVKYIRDYVREGQKVVCKVLAVNPNKGHVDLSLKAVNEHQRREKIQEWKNEQRADKLLELLAQKLGMDLKVAIDTIAVPLVDRYGSLYGSFEAVSINHEQLTHDGFQGVWIPEFCKLAIDNIVPPLITIGGVIEMTCYQKGGVDHLKKALLMAEENAACKIQVQYMGAPRYRITATALDYKTAEDEIKKSATNAINYIKKQKGDGKFIRKE